MFHTLGTSGEISAAILWTSGSLVFAAYLNSVLTQFNNRGAHRPGWSAVSPRRARGPNGVPGSVASLTGICGKCQENHIGLNNTLSLLYSWSCTPHNRIGARTFDTDTSQDCDAIRR